MAHGSHTDLEKKSGALGGSVAHFATLLGSGGMWVMAFKSHSQDVGDQTRHPLGSFPLLFPITCVTALFFPR